MPEAASLEYRPRWAPHVVGRYGEREHDRETGEPEPQRVRMECERCGDTHQVECRSGQPREHVAKFAILHLHRDAMKQPLPMPAGSP